MSTKTPIVEEELDSNKNINNNDNNVHHHPIEEALSSSPLSYALEELGSMLGGTGRAKACWDCYRIGVDPIWFWDNNFDNNNKEERESVGCINGIEDSSSSLELTGWTRQQIIDSNLIDRNRVKNAGLGKKSMQLLKEKFGGFIEDEIATLSKITTTLDGATKLLLKLHHDNLEIETVIIPWHSREKRKSSTLCVSSQVGCKQACAFCMTGRMGKLRSLSADEILIQLHWANKICRLSSSSSSSSLSPLYEINNVVFMGMGEPADNIEAACPASQRMMDQHLFQLANRRVTTSTVAPSPDSFRQLLVGSKSTTTSSSSRSGDNSDDNETNDNNNRNIINGAALAWSVHSTRDDLRKDLVPTTKHSMEELRHGLIDVLKGRTKRQRNVMLEITLLDNVNDNSDDAHHLVEFVQPILKDVPGIKLIINLIPWNDIGATIGPASSYKSPTPSKILNYQKMLIDNNLLCYVRTTRGDEEHAACGVLATKTKSEKNK